MRVRRSLHFKHLSLNYVNPRYVGGLGAGGEGFVKRNCPRDDIGPVCDKSPRANKPLYRLGQCDNT